MSLWSPLNHQFSRRHQLLLFFQSSERILSPLNIFLTHYSLSRSDGFSDKNELMIKGGCWKLSNLSSLSYPNGHTVRGQLWYMYYIYIIDVHINWLGLVPFPPMFCLLHLVSYIIFLAIFLTIISYLIKAGRSTSSNLEVTFITHEIFITHLEHEIYIEIRDTLNV